MMERTRTITLADRDLDDMAAVLEASDRYRMPKWLVAPLPAPMPPDLLRRGLFVDVETPVSTR